jgi:DNA polymerase-3 subunit alpha
MSQQQPQFVHLHVHSAYSLAEGAIRTKELIGLCQEQGMPAAAVTDTNNLFGALEFAMAAKSGGVQPIIGCQLSFGHERHELVLLVQNEQGYQNLSAIVSRAYLEDKEQVEAKASWDDLEIYHEGLICLTGGLKGPVCQYLLHNQSKDAETTLKKLKKTFGDRLYIELQRHDMPEQDRIEPQLIDLAYKHNIALVATNDAYFTDRSMHEAHDALLCIAEGRYVTESDRRKATPEHYLKSEQEMLKIFEDLPEAIANTIQIAQRCSFLLKPIDPILPAFPTADGRTEVEELRTLSLKGLEWRLKSFVFPEAAENADFDEVAKPYRERLEFELNVIIEMGFPGYFLIVSDFIVWAKEQNIPVGPGRGSGAGSVVAWVLKITDLDPLRFNLLFERFLNPERVSMPDFDVDFCQDRRDEVIRYVQDKYGYDRVAQIITFGKLQARAVVRDVGRVLQMSYGQVDRIAKMIPSNPANPLTLQEALDQDKDLRAEINREEASRKLIDIALKLEGLYRHASTHAAGVVIGDRPLQELVPLYRDPRSDMPVTQFNMKYVEQAGLVKFDFLGLKTLTVIQKAVEYIKKSTGEEIDILKIPFEDVETFEMLKAGNNTGVFQMESAGMRDLGRQMKVSHFEQIIALVALYRPGPMENIPKYIACLNGTEERDFMHPVLQPILEETYGIMIYQEQVMQAAQLLAGYTLGAADLLRRAMGKKIQSEMDAQRKLFVDGAKAMHDVGADQANYIFDQIAKFAGYGFNKAHSAGYALVAYWTAWLKARYPVEFMAASMTLDKGNTDKLAVFKQALDRMKIDLLPPSVNHSGVDFEVEDKAVRYALSALKGVGSAAMEVVVTQRHESGAYKDVYDFVERVGSALNKKQIEMLSAAGGIDEIHNNRAQIYTAAEMLMRYAQNAAEERESGQNSLFGGGDAAIALTKPPLPTVQDWDHLDRLSYEHASIGFFLSAHPLDGREKQLEKLDITSFIDLEPKMQYKSSMRLQMAGVLLKKQERISAKSGKKYAFLSMSDHTGFYEVMIFSETLAAAREFLVEGNTLLLVVDVEAKDDQLRLMGQMVGPLDDAVERTTQRCEIVLDHVSNIESLKTILDDEGTGQVKLGLRIKQDNNKYVRIELDQRYNFSATARRSIQNTDGVARIMDL